MRIVGSQHKTDELEDKALVQSDPPVYTCEKKEETNHKRPMKKTALAIKSGLTSETLLEPMAATTAIGFVNERRLQGNYPLRQSSLSSSLIKNSQTLKERKWKF